MHIGETGLQNNQAVAACSWTSRNICGYLFLLLTICWANLPHCGAEHCEVGRSSNFTILLLPKTWLHILTVTAKLRWGWGIELLSALARKRHGQALRRVVALTQSVIPSAGRQSIQEIGLHGSVYGSLRSLICIFPQITRCTPADCFVLLTIKNFLLCFSNSVYICSIMSWHMGPTSHRQVV